MYSHLTLSCTAPHSIQLMQFLYYGQFNSLVSCLLKYMLLWWARWFSVHTFPLPFLSFFLLPWFPPLPFPLYRIFSYTITIPSLSLLFSFHTFTSHHSLLFTFWFPCTLFPSSFLHFLSPPSFSFTPTFTPSHFDFPVPSVPPPLPPSGLNPFCFPFLLLDALYWPFPSHPLLPFPPLFPSPLIRPHSCTDLVPLPHHLL